MMFPTINTNSSVTETLEKEATVSNDTLSFVFNFEAGDFTVKDGRVTACEGLTALKIWVKKILQTGLNRFRAYDGTDYGSDIEDLTVGNRYSRDFVMSELRREITDALKKNPHITGVTDFESEYDGGDSVKLKFRVVSDYGETTEEVSLIG